MLRGDWAEESALHRLERTLPYTLLAANDFDAGARRMHRTVAARNAREIAPDPPGWRSALRFDVDRSDAGAAWIDAGLPPPNLIVRRSGNGHAHLVYLLAVWVDERESRSVHYAAAIDRAMTRALGADPSYAGMFHHNPLHPDAWDVLEVRAAPYSLGELATYLDLDTSFAPTSSGLGRNVEVFDRLRRWARGAVRSYRDDRSAWDAAVRAKAEQFAGDVRREYGAIVGGHPYRDSEVKATAKSVGRWTWDYARPGALRTARRIVAAKKAALRAAERRKAAGAVTRDVYLAPAAQRRTEAARLRAEGVTVREVARRLEVTEREIYRLLAAPQPTLKGSSAPQNLRGDNPRVAPSPMPLPEGSAPSPPRSEGSPAPQVTGMRTSTRRRRGTGREVGASTRPRRSRRNERSNLPRLERTGRENVARMKRTVGYTRSAERDLLRLRDDDADAVEAAIETYASSTHGDVKKLQGFKQPTYRLRVGRFRVLFRLEGSMVVVTQISDRRDAYR